MPLGWGKKEPRPPNKAFRIPASDIRPVALGYGACIATDRITVHGDRVGFMVREAPEHDADSGWQFTAGAESQAYMDDPANSGVYDINTIANYDPDIIPFLNAPTGTVLVRWPAGASLGPEPGAPPIAEHERLPLAADWSIEVPTGFRRSVEGGTLTLVRPGPIVLTILIDIWDVPPDVSADSLLADVQNAQRPADAEVYDEAGAAPKEHRFGTWYREVADGRQQWALYAYTIRPDSYVQAAFISDAPDPDWAHRAWRSLERSAGA